MARLSSTPARRAVWIMLLVALTTAVAAATIIVGSRFLRDPGPDLFRGGVVVPTLALDQTWDKSTNPALDAMSGIAVGPDGNLYVVSQFASEILVLSPDGALVRRWGERGTGDGQFDLVTNGNWNIDVGGIAVAADGTVYVADTFNRRIQAFDPMGRFLRTWGSYGTGDGQFLVPIDVTIDADGAVLVVDAARGDVQRFSPDGTPLGIVPGGGAHDGVKDHATGTRTEADGTVYDVDPANGWLNSWMPDGSFRSSLLLAGTGSASVSQPFLAAPTDTAIDAEGNLYLTELDRLLLFTPGGELASTWVSPDTQNDAGWMPIAIAADGTVYLSGDHAIYRLRVSDRHTITDASPVAPTPRASAAARRRPRWSRATGIGSTATSRWCPIDVPPGWRLINQRSGLVVLAAPMTGGGPSDLNRYVLVSLVGDTSVDPCQAEPVSTNPPTGPGVDDLVDALTSQAGFHLVSPVTDVADGFSGRTFEQEALVSPGHVPGPRQHGPASTLDVRIVPDAAGRLGTHLGRRARTGRGHRRQRDPGPDRPSAPIASATADQVREANGIVVVHRLRVVEQAAGRGVEPRPLHPEGVEPCTRCLPIAHPEPPRCERLSCSRRRRGRGIGASRRRPWRPNPPPVPPHRSSPQASRGSSTSGRRTVRWTARNPRPRAWSGRTAPTPTRSWSRMGRGCCTRTGRPTARASPMTSTSRPSGRPTRTAATRSWWSPARRPATRSPIPRGHLTAPASRTAASTARRRLHRRRHRGGRPRHGRPQQGRGIAGAGLPRVRALGAGRAADGAPAVALSRRHPDHGRGRAAGHGREHDRGRRSPGRRTGDPPPDHPAMTPGPPTRTGTRSGT